MEVIIVQENLAIPARNIAYLRLLEDTRIVDVCTGAVTHSIPFDTLDEAMEFFDDVVETIHRLN